jgi:hypothetical protein
VLALDERSGRIAGYVSLAGSAAREPVPVASPQRPPFPCEIAHGINLFDSDSLSGGVPLPDSQAQSSEVWEVGRLTHASTYQSNTQATRDDATRLRLTLELMLGFYAALSRLDPPARLLVGDGEEGTIRRLRRTMTRIAVIEGTTPALPDGALLAPAYTVRRAVRPFVAQPPGGPALAALVASLRRVLSADDPFDGFRRLAAGRACPVERVTVARPGAA